jgi:MFS family permease
LAREQQSAVMNSEGVGLMQKIRSELGFIRGNFLIILTGWLLVDFSREMAFTYYPLYVQALGGTASTVGLIGSASAITEAFIKFPGGYIADKYGRKKIIMTMTFMAAIAYLFYALAPSWHFILIGAVLTSICWIYTPAFDSIVMESLPEEKRGTGYSMINLITKVSTTPSPLLAGLLFTSFGLVTASRISFLVVSLTFVIASVLRSRLVETDEEKQQINGRELLRSFSGARSFIDGIGVWRQVPRTLLALLGVELLFIVPNVMFNTTLIFFFVEELGITEVQLATLMTVIGVSMILLTLPAGKLIDRIGRKKPLLFAFLLLALIIPLMFVATYELILIFTPLIGLINVIFYSAIQALYADMTPAEHRGKISGSKSFFTLIGVSVGQISGGLVYDYVSHTLPLTLFWAATIPAFLLTLLYIKEPSSAETIGNSP